MIDFLKCISFLDMAFFDIHVSFRGCNHLTRRCDEEIIDDGRVEGTMIYLPPEVRFLVPSVDGT